MSTTTKQEYGAEHVELKLNSVQKWTGAPLTLLQQFDQAQLAQTTNGTLVLGYLNTSGTTNSGSLTLTSGGVSVPLTAPAGLGRPGIEIRNWQANNLNVTNTSTATDTPIWIAAIAPGLPGVVPATLTANGPSVSMAVWGSAQGVAVSNTNVLFLQTAASSIAIFVIIGGPTDASGNNAYVVAVNDSVDGNTGPGTGNAPPPGYYATTNGNSYSFPANWPGATIFAANLSPVTGTTSSARLVSF
jgi:hypothetical protein